jgi:diphosphomevalonate decarboxylase
MPPSVAAAPGPGPRPGGASARAHSNIALAKYWGKSDKILNLPAVPSLSLTLAALATTTRVRFGQDVRTDRLVLNGEPVDALGLSKVRALLDRVRQAAGIQLFAEVESRNDFPTASGLASSASGFAALALASLGAVGLTWPASEVSALARAASVSAARSIFGGFVTLEAGAGSAEPLPVGPEAQQLVMVIAITELGAKAVGSTSGMLRTQASSPYYEAWRANAPEVYRELRAALLDADFEKLGDCMEHSTLLMHATMLTARPAIVYFNPATLAAMSCVRELRQQGTFAYFTMDAGPHVKVLTLPAHRTAVESALSAVPGVRQVIPSGVGQGAQLVVEGQ